MEQLANIGDDRQVGSCAYCYGPPETRDHVPPRVFLDEPYPSNLPIVGSCRACNEGASADEEYVACLVECVIAGSADAADVSRPKVRRILTDRPALATRLANARMGGGVTRFEVEAQRVNDVVLKLARGHALFELNEPQHGQPTSMVFAPLDSLSAERRGAFEQPPDAVLWPEVGSRGMQRLVASADVVPEWLVVQPGRYRYLAYVDDATVIRVVLSEYLACEVVWTHCWQGPESSTHEADRS